MEPQSWLRHSGTWRALVLVLFHVSQIDNNKGEVTGSVTLLLLVIGFFVQAAFYSFMLKDPAGVALGYGRACLVTLIQVAVAAVALGAIYLMALGAIALSKG